MAAGDAARGAAMYGFGEGVLLPVSLAVAARADNVLVMTVGGWFGGD